MVQVTWNVVRMVNICAVESSTSAASWDSFKPVPVPLSPSLTAAVNFSFTKVDQNDH